MLELGKGVLSSKIKLALMILIVFLVISTIILLFLGVFKFFQLILPSILSFLIVLCFIIYILFLVTRFLLFPGSFWLWRRNLENQFSKAISNKSLVKIKQLKNIIEYLLHKTRGTEAKNMMKEELYEMQKMINSYIHTFQMMEAQKTITRQQRFLLDNINELQKLLKETKLKTNSNNENSFWEWMENSGSFLFLLKDQVAIIEFENEEQGEIILKKCQILENLFENLIEKKRFLSNLYRWFFNNTLGTIDQMRVELQNRFRTKRIILTTSNNKKLDCMFISSSQENLKKKILESVDPATIDNSNAKVNISLDTTESTLDVGNAGSIMLFCNPNGGFYEYMYYESDWIEFYCRSGINIFLWNYRGYGKSEGTPSPQNIEEDGRLIIDYLRTKMNFKKIGVHGQSLGGAVATHLAFSKNLDFLCADRTFASLSSILTFAFSHCLSKALHIITNWNKNIAYEYMKAKCYKLTCYDPKDEIIPLLGSMQIGAIKEVMLERFNYKLEEENFIYAHKGIKLAVSAVKNLFLRKYLNIKNEKNAQVAFKNYFETNFLSINEFNLLFKALERIVEIIIEMSKYKSTGKKMHKRYLSSDDAQLEKLKNKDSNLKTQISGNSGSLDSSLNVSNISVINPPNFKDDAIPMGEIFINNVEKNPDVSILLNNTQDIVEGKNNFNFEENEEQNKHLDLRNLKEQANYIDLLTDKEKNSDGFQNCILEIFSNFDSLDAGGVSLSDIFLNYHKNRRELLQIFFPALELWGSYLPLKMIVKKKMNLNLHQKFAFTKLKEFIRKNANLIKEQRKNSEINVVHEKVLFLVYFTKYSKVIRDLETINYLITLIYQKLQKGYIKMKENNQLLTSAHENIEKNDIEQNIQTEFFTNSQLGNLLPLGCGHNGCFSKKETQIYELHLKNAGFI